MIETIHIFHTNDLHSHFEYWPRMQKYIVTQRQMYAKLGQPSFLIDIGDHLDRSNIYTEATLGKGNVQLLNEAQYDVVTIGNNEGITLSFDELYSLYDKANFEVVVANLKAKTGNDPSWLKPYTILETKYGTKIGVIAATAVFKMFYDELNWDVLEPYPIILDLVEKLKEEVNIIIFLSHLGLSFDEKLAKDCPDIDVIFGSHTHHLLMDGKFINNVLLTGCGKFGMYTGHLTIQYDHSINKVVEKQETVIENALLPEEENEIFFLEQLMKEGKEILQEPIFETTKFYNKEWFHYSNLSHLFADALFDFTGADCAMFNAGIFLESLSKGTVTKYDIHKILPHPINACVIELTGKELVEILQAGDNSEWPLLELKGLGFRGTIFGKLLTYKFSLNKEGELMVNGQLANLNKVYRLATLDLFTFGYFFPSLKVAKKKYLLPQFLRDILVEYGKKKSIL